MEDVNEGLRRTLIQKATVILTNRAFVNASAAKQQSIIDQMLVKGLDHQDLAMIQKQLGMAVTPVIPASLDNLDLSMLENLPYDVFVTLVMLGNVAGKDLIRICNTSRTLNGYCNKSKVINGVEKTQWIFRKLLADKYNVILGHNEDPKESYKLHALGGELFTFGSDYLGRPNAIHHSDPNDLEYPEGGVKWSNPVVRDIDSIPNFKNIRKVSVGGNYMAFITANNELYAFGQNKSRELGTGTHKNSNSPLRVIIKSPVTGGIIPAEAIDVSCAHSGMIFCTEEGIAYITGHYPSFALDKYARETSHLSLFPLDIPGTGIGTDRIKVTHVSHGGSCIAMISDKKLYTMAMTNIPKGRSDNAFIGVVPGFNNVTCVSCFDRSTTFIDSGKLYTINDLQNDVPKLVTPIEDIIYVSLGGYHLAFITSDNHMYTIGYVRPWDDQESKAKGIGKDEKGAVGRGKNIVTGVAERVKIQVANKFNNGTVEEDVLVKHVSCSDAKTMLVTTDGRTFSAGSQYIGRDAFVGVYFMDYLTGKETAEEKAAKLRTKKEQEKYVRVDSSLFGEVNGHYRNVKYVATGKWSNAFII